jgi:hypothetical protein
MDQSSCEIRFTGIDLFVAEGVGGGNLGGKTAEPFMNLGSSTVERYEP